MRNALIALFLFFSAFTVPVFADDGGADPAATTEAAAPADAEEKAEEAGSEDKAETAVAEVEAPSSEDVEGAAESVSLLVDALQSKQWGLALGILLSLLVAFANKFGLKDKVGSKAIPWVTSGLAVAGAIGASLMSGVAITEALSQGLVAGMTAIGGWEMVLKHIFAKKAEEASA